MNELYVAVQTSYYGPTYCYHYPNVSQLDIGDCCEDACATAFGEYEKLAENADVPAAELYQSVSLVEVSSSKPTCSYYEYV